MTKVWIDNAGKQLRSTDDKMTLAKIKARFPTAIKAIKNPTPESGLQIWQGSAWSPLPLPESEAEKAEKTMLDDPLQRALIKREARSRGITPRQLMNEIMQDA